jgi:hypothetical protein
VLEDLGILEDRMRLGRQRRSQLHREGRQLLNRPIMEIGSESVAFALLGDRQLGGKQIGLLFTSNQFGKVGSDGDKAINSAAW